MRDRAAAAAGTLTIRSGPKGTTVRMTVPGKAPR
jgi:signal transduction histidine kinase